MSVYVLAVPYVLIPAIQGIKWFILETLAQETDLEILQSFKALNIRWYKWLAHSLKDWIILGFLGGAALCMLAGRLPLVFSALVITVDLVLLGQCLLTGLFLLHSVWAQPNTVINKAVLWALPKRPAGSQLRAAGWGAALLLAAASGLFVWVRAGSFPALLWSFVCLTLGFLSAFRGFLPERIEEDIC